MFFNLTLNSFSPVLKISALWCLALLYRFAHFGARILHFELIVEFRFSIALCG